MTKAEKILFELSRNPLPVIDPNIPLDRYIEIDLSSKNSELSAYNITDPGSCQDYVDLILKKNNALAAYGGYLEGRNLYESPNFTVDSGPRRNIHLGMDFWAPINTAVVVPWQGRIHSFCDNRVEGDYGPTIILKHSSAELVFFSLYGHLSRESLDGLKVDQAFEQGETLAFLGSKEVNGQYAPHLHFQLILDPGHYLGDYPGVCSRSELEFYQINCPNPDLLLKISSGNIG